jgi:plasmid replication initiation protein
MLSFQRVKTAFRSVESPKIWDVEQQWEQVQQNMNFHIIELPKTIEIVTSSFVGDMQSTDKEKIEIPKRSNRYVEGYLGWGKVCTSKWLFEGTSRCMY